MSIWRWLFEGRTPRRATEPVRLSRQRSVAEQAPVLAHPVPAQPMPAQARPSGLVLPQNSFRFVALDVETANAAFSSVCQIGLAFVTQDGAVEVSSTYVDTGHPFNPFNTQLHGIGPDHVRGAPSFPRVFQLIAPLLQNNLIIQHSNFDRQAIHACCRAAGIEVPDWRWADSVQIARRAWPEFRGNGGHGLGHLKTALGIEFEHHDAGEDAKAAAMVVLKAEAHTGMRLEDLITSPSRGGAQAGQSRARAPRKPVETPDPTPHLDKLGELIALLREREVLPREEIARLRKARLAEKLGKPIGWKHPDEHIPYLDLSDEERRAAQNDLSVHVANLDLQCRRYFQCGDPPAPGSAMRIAIILARSKLGDLEHDFLSVWCRHFRDAGFGRTYEELEQRAEKRGILKDV